MQRCVNIDWLEVYVIEHPQLFPCDADFFSDRGWKVVKRDYGTRVYSQMFTIYDVHDEPFLEIRRAPYSTIANDGGLFPQGSAHIRLHNRACYLDNPIGLLREFLARYNYEFVKIFRIDICLDFEKFDKGDDPANFIERYMKGRYSKINQSNISAHGQDEWAGRTWNSLSWGKRKSMVGTKMYCKTLELEQEKDKPYIWYSWFQAGLIDDFVSHTKSDGNGGHYRPTIWRVEFSIKSSAAKVFTIERATGRKKNLVMPHTLDVYDNRQKLLFMFSSLAQHYFHFKHYQEDQRKDRCEDKILFQFSPSDTFYKIDRQASHVSMSKPTDRLIKLLEKYKETHFTPDLIRACNVLIDALKTETIRLNMPSDMSSSDIILLRHLLRFRMEHPETPLSDAIRLIRDTMREDGSFGLF